MAERSDVLLIVVAGLPPIKNEAKSMLAAGHSNADRVRALLVAARNAMLVSGWRQTGVEIALDLIIRARGKPPADATNFLGGIGDVLQARKRGANINLEHLGSLCDVAVFDDDHQISQIEYREEQADAPSYTVRIRSLRSRPRDPS